MESDLFRFRLLGPLLLVSLLAHLVLAWLLPHGKFEFIYAYHQLLAEGFLQGKLHLVSTPVSGHDLSSYQGQLFMYWGPAPALMLMPIVAVWGTSWPPFLLSLALGVLGTLLAYLMLAVTAHVHRLDSRRAALLALTYSLGSPSFPLSMRGSVWFVSQLFGTVFLFVAVSGALRRPSSFAAALTSAASLSLACLSRLSMLCAAPVVLGWLAGYFGAPRADFKRPKAVLMGVASVLGLSVTAWMAYNFFRFGDPLETGLSHHNAGGGFRNDIVDYGIFSFHYFSRNFYYQYLSYPFTDSQDPLMGGSLFLLTPLYVAAFWAFRPGPQRGLLVALAASVVMLAVPSLLVCGTGWVQIGPRYTLDFAPMIMLLSAIGMARWPLWLVVLLSLLSIAQYVAALIAFPLY